MTRTTIDEPFNEASALIGIQNRMLLDARNWDVAFWAVSDERPAQKAVSAIGRRAGSDEWDVVPLKITLSAKSDTKASEDCETMARAGSWVYVLGSQFGPKVGPLEPRRHFVMRFNEALIETRKKSVRVEADLVRRPFLLHRIVNDALVEHGVELIGAAGELTDAFVRRARKRGQKQGKSWRDLVKKADRPLNVEGSTFLPGGRLLLGLRYPVTVDGHPILVELEGLDRLFDDEVRDPVVTAIHIVSNVGTASKPAGVRELDSMSGVVHVITGNLDSEQLESMVVEGTEGGDRAPNEHWTVEVTPGETGLVTHRGTRIRKFRSGSTVEGMALVGDRVWYAHDAETIVLEDASL
jgi:hypothetical protein